MASEQTVQSTSIGCGGLFATLLAILLIYLKLNGTIDWSWWWVLAPVWIPMAIVGVIMAIVLGVLAIVVMREQ